MFLHKFAGLLNLKIKLTALVCKQVGLMNFYMGKNTMERQNFIIQNLVVEDDENIA